MHKLVFRLCCLLVVGGLCFYCERQTQGFRFYRLLSSIPDDPQWETERLGAEHRLLLDQTFTFIGKGGFCCAFLGEDQKTVLKFYLHTHLKPLPILQDFSWQKLYLKSAPCPPIPYLTIALKSSKLLFDHAKDRTGLIHLQLNKSDREFSSVTLIDPLGIRHTIDLNETEFILQQRAEPLVHYLARAIKEKNMDAAKAAIDNYLDCLLHLCKRGLKDLDNGFRNNYGILSDGNVISMDISSFAEDASLMRPSVFKKEIILKSHNLGRWLKHRHSGLLAHFDQRLIQLIENE